MVQAKFAFKKMMNKYILWNLFFFFLSMDVQEF